MLISLRMERTKIVERPNSAHIVVNIWVGSIGECRTKSTAGSWFDSNLIHHFSLQRIIFLTRFNENERLVTSHLDAILSEAVEAETLYGLALVKVYE